MKCATSDPSKGGRETILQSKKLYQSQYNSRKDEHNKGLDYLDENGIRLEAMGPIQETLGKMNPRKIYSYAI